MIKFFMMPMITSNDSNTYVSKYTVHYNNNNSYNIIIIIWDPKSVKSNYLKMKVFQHREKP